jgi:hypothetical protein
MSSKDKHIVSFNVGMDGVTKGSNNGGEVVLRSCMYILMGQASTVATEHASVVAH